jgi:hypothetical protein
MRKKILWLGVLFIVFLLFILIWPRIWHAESHYYERILQNNTVRECENIEEKRRCWEGIYPIFCDEMNNCVNGKIIKQCFWNQESKKCESTKVTCKDFDDGLDYYEKSFTYAYESEEDVSRDGHEDYCGVVGHETGMLKEYYCIDEYIIGHELYECPNGCANGVCLEN